jgi:hypothetical protein
MREAMAEERLNSSEKKLTTFSSILKCYIVKKFKSNFDFNFSEQNWLSKCQVVSDCLNFVRFLLAINNQLSRL